ncbi:MAG: hypothetical protein P8X74_16555 [Reinekea sp.]
MACALRRYGVTDSGLYKECIAQWLAKEIFRCLSKRLSYQARLN